MRHKFKLLTVSVVAVLALSTGVRGLGGDGSTHRSWLVHGFGQRHADYGKCTQQRSPQRYL